jgi:uncharacterized protein (TIRG00374 family)
MSDRRLRNRLSGVAASRLWVGVGLSVLAVYLSVRDVQWGEVAKVLLHSDRLVLLLALGTVLLNTWMKAVRWRLLFYPAHSRLSVWTYLLALLVGQLGNRLLPARLGDLARIYMIGEGTGISRALALATTIVEKAIDSVMLLALIALLSLRMPMPLWLARSSVLLSSLLAALLFAMLLLASRNWSIAEVLQRRAEGHASPAVLQAFGRLVEAGHSLGALSDPSVQMQVWVWSFLIWLTAAATNVLAFWALGLGANVPPSLVLLVVLMTGAALPTSPLQIGVFHYLCVLTLTLFGVEHSVALSYAIVLHFVVHLPIVVGGALGLWVGQLDLTELDTNLAAQGG